MNKKLLAGLVAVLALGGLWSISNQETMVGGSFNGTSALSNWTNVSNGIASASSKGLVNVGPSRVFSVRVSSDATSVRYIQLFNLATTSKGFSHTITPVLSIPIVAATASSSPTIVTLDSAFFAPALRFGTGLVWTISSSPTEYASASVVPARHTVNVIYEPFVR